MAVVIFGLIHVIGGMPYIQLMTVFTDDILKVGATGLGILTSISAAGAMIGTFILASLPNRKRGLLLLVSGVILSVAIILFTWSESWVIALAVMPLAGIGTTMHMAMTATIVQYYVEPDYRGRMQSFVTMTVGLSGLGTFVAGMLADLIGIQWAVGGMAILLLIVSIGFILFFPRLSLLD